MAIKFRTAYGDHVKVGIDCSVEPTMTKGSFKAECDINNIIKKYHKTGLIDFVNAQSASYGDFTGFDFNQAMDTVAMANQMFSDLPANIRKRFHNDAVEFVQFVSDDKNRAAAEAMGLVRRREQDPPPSSVDSAAGGGKTVPPSGNNSVPPVPTGQA